MISPEDKTICVAKKDLKKLMVGKTIKSIENDSMNVLNIEFTDGSELMFETEHVGHSIYGMVGYVRKDD
jgi:hypothetical protein